MPFKSVVPEKIIHIPDQITLMPYMKTANDPYAEISFKKSFQTVNYERSFNKVDAYFSYVGGLVGTIIGLIFIMGPYT